MFGNCKENQVRTVNYRTVIEKMQPTFLKQGYAIKYFCARKWCWSSQVVTFDRVSGGELQEPCES